MPGRLFTDITSISFRTSTISSSNYYRLNFLVPESLLKDNLDRFDSTSLVASLTSPGFMTLTNQRNRKEKDSKKSDLASNLVQQITNLAKQVESEQQQQATVQAAEQQCNNNNASSSSSEGSTGRSRRPALQCHKCAHCAAPDCAK